MCLPMSGLGLAAQATDTKPMKLLTPGLSLMMGGKKKQDAVTATPPNPGYGSGSQGNGAMSYGG